MLPRIRTLLFCCVLFFVFSSSAFASGWQPLHKGSAPLNVAYSSSWSPDGTALFLGGRSPLIDMFKDGKWTSNECGLSYVTDIHGISETEVYAVGLLSKNPSPGMIMPKVRIPEGEYPAVSYYNGKSWVVTILPDTATYRAPNAVWAVASGDVWVAGRNGDVWHLADGTWQRVSDIPCTLGYEPSYYDVWGRKAGDAVTVYLAGSQTVRWDGNEWTEVDVDLTSSGTDADSVLGFDDGTVFVGDDDDLFRLDPVTGEWTNIAAGLDPERDCDFEVLGGTSSSNLYAGEEGVYRWDGSALTPLVVTADPDDEYDFVSVTPLADGKVLVLTAGGARYMFTGAEHTVTYSGVPYDSYVSTPFTVLVAKDDAWFIHDEEVWHWDGTGYAKVGEFAGDSRGWVAIPEGLAVLHSDPSAVGAYRVAVCTTGGVTETEQLVMGAQWLGGTAADNLWVVGDNGAISHWDGTQWTAQNSGVVPRLKSVWAVSAADVWAVGCDNTVLHLVDGTWTSVAAPFGAGNDVIAVRGDSANDVWFWAVSSEDGTCLVARYDGIQISTVTLPDTVKISPLAMELKTFFSMADGQVVIFDYPNAYIFDGEGRWVTCPEQQNYMMVSAAMDAGEMIAVNPLGRMFVFSGKGVTKIEEPQPVATTVQIISVNSRETTAGELNSEYGLDGFVPKTEIHEFTATIERTDGGLERKGIFSFTVSGISGSVGDLELRKLLSDGTSIVYDNFVAGGDIDSPQGAWWIKNADGVALAAGDALAAAESYTVSFVVVDNGRYDINPAEGVITDPVVLGSLGASSGGGSGCSLNPGAGVSFELVALLLAAIAVLAGRRFSRR